MARHRLGVALLVPAPVAVEIDALRSALGATDLDRMPPHLTLVPPVNVRDDEVDDALDRLRDAAGRTRPFRLELGPPATFLPVNPVLYLQVGGDVPAVDGLRDRVFRHPLERPLTWPFHPHVTLLDGGTEHRIRAGVEALADWRAEVVLDRVHLMREERREDGERWWRPVAEVPFGEPAVVGRGGVELELEVAGLLSIDAERFRSAAWADHEVARFGDRFEREPLTVTARRGGRVVATAEGELREEGEAYLARLIVAADERNQGIGERMLAAFGAAAAARGATFVSLRTEAEGPARHLCERLGYTHWYDLPAWRRGRTYVAMRRWL